MALTNLAIIVIVVVCCLAVTALGAGIASFYSPPEDGKSRGNSETRVSSVTSQRLNNFTADIKVWGKRLWLILAL
ncbi:uncharacterized protein BO80DRAFT_465292 [Aspergillus ibericus CBS 121593]|uniref:Uncharacterized protein n=1 Tax=Aspergillus ibericus CBS 121593 TaxID=1448316 RepID=A0A395GYN6_9EURO|nr:hypothetical protein BO80DRAFT_465292 [Aspergillus ibericus CBS 121593]RAL00470.1 hypothetical protein BO80DRAFT_465292 [Aspergillus ibericus CBS 121593]